MHDRRLDRTERFIRVYEGAGLRFRLDDAGDLVVGIATRRNWPDGVPPLLLEAIEIRAGLIVDVLKERQADLAMEAEPPDEDERIAELERCQVTLAERAMQYE